MTETINPAFKLKETQKFSNLINEYIKTHNEHPFTNIEMEEDSSEVNIDINVMFEKTLSDEFNNLEEVMSDYINSLIIAAMKQPDSKDSNE